MLLHSTTAALVMQRMSSAAPEPMRQRASPPQSFSSPLQGFHIPDDASVGLRTAHFGIATPSIPVAGQYTRDSISSAYGMPEEVNDIAFTRQLPDYNSIRLRTLTVASASQFFHRLMLFRRQNGYTVRAAGQIDGPVMELVLAKNWKIGSVEDFLALTNFEIFRAVRQSLRPVSSSDFGARLTEAVIFPSLPARYVFEFTAFEPMFTAVCTYVRNFYLAFDFLDDPSCPQLLPRCDKNAGGLILMFITPIPFNFGHKVLAALPLKRFDSFRNFIDQFMVIVQQIHDGHATTRAYSHFFEGQSSGVATHPPRSWESSSNRHRPPGSPDYRSRGPSGMSSQQSFDRRVPAEAHDPRARSGDVRRDSWGPPRDSGDARLQWMNDFSYPDHSLSEADYAHGPVPDYGYEPDYEPTDVFCQISSETKACHAKLRGNCTRANCIFSHEEADLRRLWLEDTRALRQSPFADSVPSRASSVRPTSAAGTVAFVSPSDSDPDFATALACIADSLLAGAGISKSSQARFSQDANISVGSPDMGYLLVDTVPALFDTGASDSTYLSKTWVDRHRGELTAAGALSPAAAEVTLADSNLKIQITEVCSLLLDFNHCGTSYSAPVTCRVMDRLATTLLIGLPDIVSSFLPLVIVKLHELAERNTSHSPIREDVACQILEPWSSPVDISTADSAEEEAPLPVMFADALMALSTDRDVAVQAFHDAIESQVSPELLLHSTVRSLLVTKGVKVFVPSNWDGISGIAPIELQWSPDLPPRIMPKVRQVNPKLLENTKREFDRLCTHHLEPSASSIASAIVVAPKATSPFIRLCGDYTQVNKFVISGASIIPDVRKQLDRIRGFPVYVDLDLTTAFHQIRLGPITSDRLSLVTMWGQVRPRFLPEGVTPASAILQQVVSDVFQGFDDFLIVIFDNLLILAHDAMDACTKFETVLDRCIERNVFLKFSKSFIGFREVSFFGYQCRLNAYSLSDSRKQAVLSIPMPDSQKAMQRFLGTTIFFQSFMPNFSILTADLHDMVRSDFNWQQRPFAKDYATIFDRFKQQLLKSVELFYPDYSLEWVLRVDASDRGVGSVLFQLQLQPDGSVQHQPIAFHSKKFSEVATRWSVYEKEAFAIYFGVFSNEYYLRAKPFTVETDHRNLQWLESSLIPKVIRWRSYLQGFKFLIRHIAGVTNTVADWQSRMFLLTSLPLSRLSILEECHGKRSLHPGAHITYLNLNKFYPGHGISMQMVRDFVSSCAVCQKVRLYLHQSLPPSVRNLKQPHIRSAVGIDTLELPTDENGFRYVHVIRNLFSKLVVLYPVKDHSATTLALSIFQFFTTFGIYEVVISDPGSDLTSEVITSLHKWLGMHHRFSLVGRHESNGVEAANRQILRYLRALFSDERISKRWSDASVIGWIQYLMNIYDTSETGGISPMEITFGSTDKSYFRIPDSTQDTKGYVTSLNQDLIDIRSLVAKYQHMLVSKDNVDAIPQNMYQPGDYVLLHRTVTHPPASKLHPKYIGPFLVVSQYKNDVTVECLISGKSYVFFVSDLKIFIGSKADAKAAALLDSDQFEMRSILQYRGDPHLRTSMEFLVDFADGSQIWVPWSEDIYTTVYYEKFCSSIPHLRSLKFRLNELAVINAKINKTPITSISIGETSFVDMRSYGHLWFQTLDLPSYPEKIYVVEYNFVKFLRGNTVVLASCPVFKETWKLNHVFVIDYCHTHKFDSSSMILVNAQLLMEFPSLSAHHSVA